MYTLTTKQNQKENKCHNCGHTKAEHFNKLFCSEKDTEK